MEEAPAPPAPGAPPSKATPKRSALARAALILGAVALGTFCCTIGLGAAISLVFGMTAVMLGTIALERIRSSGGTLAGRRSAWTGIGCGLAAFALSLVAQFLLASVQREWNSDIDAGLHATFAAIDPPGARAAEERWTPGARRDLRDGALERFALDARATHGEFIGFKVLSEVPQPSLTGVHMVTLAVAFEFERERVTGSVVAEIASTVGRIIPVARLRSVALQRRDGPLLVVGVMPEEGALEEGTRGDEPPGDEPPGDETPGDETPGDARRIDPTPGDGEETDP